MVDEGIPIADTFTSTYRIKRTGLEGNTGLKTPFLRQKGQV
jgi:hypothetical protein